MKKLLIFGILAILLAFSVSAAPAINGAIPDQTKDEDSSAWTLDLSNYEVALNGETDLELDWSVSEVDSDKITAVLDNDMNVITFTPKVNAVGSDTIKLTLTSAIDSVTDDQTITVTLNAVNDAPVFNTVPSQEWKEGESLTLDLSAYATDVDGDSLTYTVKESPEDITVGIVGSVATLTPDKNSFKGEDEVMFSVSDGSVTVDSNAIELIVLDEDVMCEEGDRGDVSISDIDEPDDGDEFKPGEKIEVKIEVSNNDNDDVDVVVEAVLYDKEKGKVLDRAEMEDNIDEDDEMDFELELMVPYDVEASSSRYAIFLKAYEDGDEDVNCGSELIDIEVDKESHEIAIETFNLNPSTAICGDTVSATVKLFNIGEKDEDDVIVTLIDPDLGVEVSSEEFEIDEEDDYVVRLSFKVPENVKAGTYGLVVGAEYNNGRDVADEKGATLVVENCRDAKVFNLNFAGTNTLSLSMGLNDEARYSGSGVVVKEIVSNLVRLDVDGKEVGLSVGGSEVLSDDLKVSLNSVTDIASLTFTKLSSGSTFVPVERESDLTTTLLIVGDAVLVIVLIIILVIVFSRKKK
ncbi:hypothetical protein CL618_03775 [archaeon]|nr:hypothetical protein [archaeon]|tara:strand:+ start:479 stop:2209 length:1731 start_codon:yes stop_codon:yes gene_type:complete